MSWWPGPHNGGPVIVGAIVRERVHSVRRFGEFQRSSPGQGGVRLRDSSHVSVNHGAEPLALASSPNSRSGSGVTDSGIDMSGGNAPKRPRHPNAETVSHGVGRTSATR